MALRSDISPHGLPRSNRRGSGSKSEPAGVAKTFSGLSVRRGFVGGIGFALVGVDRARAIVDAAIPQVLRSSELLEKLSLWTASATLWRLRSERLGTRQ